VLQLQVNLIFHSFRHKIGSSVPHTAQIRVLPRTHSSALGGSTPVPAATAAPGARTLLSRQTPDEGREHSLCSPSAVRPQPGHGESKPAIIRILGTLALTDDRNWLLKGKRRLRLILKSPPASVQGGTAGKWHAQTLPRICSLVLPVCPPVRHPRVVTASGIARAGLPAGPRGQGQPTRGRSTL